VLRASGPITTVVHAAGVLDDATLANLDWPRFEAVLAPKVTGGWNLHDATRRDPVSTFVLYSAAGPQLDGAGQAAYAAANAYLDTLATHRRALGLPAVSVQWGPWAGAGMAARLDESHRERWRRMGLEAWDVDAAGPAFDAALCAPASRVMAVRRSRVTARTTSSPGTTGARAGVVATLRAQPAHRRVAGLREHVRTSIASLLGIESVEPDRPLREIGLDSLSAIELRNALTLSIGESLPATLAFDHPTADAIAAFLQARLFPDDVRSTPAADTPERTALPADGPTGESLDTMPDDDAEALLLAELRELAAARGAA
jgi:acyl carrier protein